MLSHLMSEPRTYYIVRAFLILGTIVVLLMLCATSTNASVSKAESGDNVKPMSAAEYAVIKARIRGPQRYNHVAQRPHIVHWRSGNASGWLSPWPR